MKSTAIIFFAAVSLCVAVPAFCEDAPEGPWSGSANLSFVSTSGNTDTQTLGFGIKADYKPNDWTLELGAGFLESENGGVTAARKLTALVGAKRAFSERFEAYARLSYLEDEFAGIASNFGGEVGALYKALTGDAHFLDLAGGLGYTTEERILDDDRDFASAVVSGAYKWQFTETAEFTEVAKLSYDLEDSDNWRFTNTAALSVAINSVFSLKVSHALSYLNEPVVGFEKTDTITSAALVAKF